MSVHLTKTDRLTLDGARGEGARLAMSIIVRMADVYGARELMDVTQAHIDGCGMLTDAGLEFAERLASGGAGVSIPTTLSMGPLDLQNWRRFGVPRAFAEKAIRQARAYESMGCLPAWTCAPYQGYLTPRFGQQIAWGESNAVVYANSVLGARTERYGDYIDICAAVTGRVPRQGLHLKENRRGQVLLRLTNVDPDAWSDGTLFPAFGYLLGKLAGSKVPVIEGFPLHATGDQLKAFGAAAASSGAVALFHAIGVTPEASSIEQAFGGNAPEETVDVGPADLEAARRELSTAGEGDPLEMVILGCPHYSPDEFRGLGEAVRRQNGASLHPGVRLIVTSSQTSHALLQRCDFHGELEAFGVEITLDTCIFHTPLVGSNVKTIMTDSGKLAYYSPGELGVRVALGSVADCVRSAVAGRIRRRDT